MKAVLGIRSEVLKALRNHKRLVHGGTLMVITLGLLVELHPLADYGFLVLSGLCEIE